MNKVFVNELLVLFKNFAEYCLINKREPTFLKFMYWLKSRKGH